MKKSTNESTIAPAIFLFKLLKSITSCRKLLSKVTLVLCISPKWSICAFDAFSLRGREPVVQDTSLDMMGLIKAHTILGLDDTNVEIFQRGPRLARNRDEPLHVINEALKNILA